MGQARHSLGQIFGGVDGLRLMRQKISQQLFNRFEAAFLRFEFPAGLGARQARFLPQIAIHVPAKFKIIGEDEIIQGAAIAFQLLAALCFSQRFPHVFGFDIADAQLIAGDDVIGRAAGNAFGFVGGGDA